ncbi:MAG: hypothetical protein AB7E95_11425 [Kiritimatiellales bacterium]
MKKGITVGLCLVLSAAATVSAELLASESFSTGNGSDYVSKKNLGDPANSVILAGTVGFSKSKPWKGSSGTIQPYSAAGLTHAVQSGNDIKGVIQIITPAAQNSTAISRKTFRELDVRPAGTSFYISTLVSMGGALKNLDVEESAVIGLCERGREDWDIKSGVHIGLAKDKDGSVYPTLFAAGKMYKLGNPLTAEQAAGTQLIVVKMDINTSGNNDTLTAWVAQKNDTVPRQVLKTDEINIGDARDLRTLDIQVLGGQDPAYTTGVRIDEFRFGTEWKDVTSASVE